MSQQMIDRVARQLAAGLPRRRVIAGLALGLLSSPLGRRPPDAAAGCKKPGQACDQNQDCCAHASCKGGKCKCKGSRKECGNDCVKTKNDEKHCGRCNRRCGAGQTCRNGACDGGVVAVLCGDVVCAATEECVGDVCTTPPGNCPPGADSCATTEDVSCGGQAGCECLQSTEGVTRCADRPIPGVFCGSCQSSDDCAEFGEDAFCSRSTNTDVCCGPSAQNACRRPCPA